LSGAAVQETENCIGAFFQQKECEMVELNVQIDHVHLLVMALLKMKIGAIKFVR
jgi:putative transposase